jgi:8-oxo-dGTP diphosphatase
MPPPYCYNYPRPAVTVDLVVFTLARGGLRVLLIRRKHDPFAGRWAIPGGFLDMDEPVEDGARRELREETGLDLRGPIAPIGFFGDPQRDPRGRTISLAHAAVLRSPVPAIGGADDAEAAAWLDPHQVSPLAFDHDAMLARALDWLHLAVLEGRMGLQILPREFGDAELHGLFRALGQPKRTANAWRNRLLRTEEIAPVPHKEGRYRVRSG